MLNSYQSSVLLEAVLLEEVVNEILRHAVRKTIFRILIIHSIFPYYLLTHNLNRERLHPSNWQLQLNESTQQSMEETTIWRLLLTFHDENNNRRDLVFELEAHVSNSW